MRVPIEQLGNNAHTWIFGISPALDAQQESVLLEHVDSFLDRWAAHGTPIRGARDLREGSFLVIAADEDCERSGCSIDRMFGTLKQLERDLGVQILDSNRVFFRDSERVRAVPRNEFARAATADTPVFDLTADHLGDVRGGAWERPARDSWHRQLLEVL
ncbi:MAG TPA: hypothetical protein VJZ00_25700 [Thermoanaerobaculia bacterium]|nr:hypothetical protein [Thermoanaerobaculia bacterium]